jgi:hypothetical protein
MMKREVVCIRVEAVRGGYIADVGNGTAKDTAVFTSWKELDQWVSGELSERLPLAASVHAERTDIHDHTVLDGAPSEVIHDS